MTRSRDERASRTRRNDRRRSVPPLRSPAGRTTSPRRPYDMRRPIARDYPAIRLLSAVSGRHHYREFRERIFAIPRAYPREAVSYISLSLSLSFFALLRRKKKKRKITRTSILEMYRSRSRERDVDDVLNFTPFDRRKRATPVVHSREVRRTKHASRTLLGEFSCFRRNIRRYYLSFSLSRAVHPSFLRGD